MRTLLIDTCGDVGSLALADGTAIRAAVDLPSRSASRALISEIQSMLRSVDWQLHHLQGLGVVSGPGSFTGVRVGLACAKGLCEALMIPLAAVSRLHVLAQAATLDVGYAALNAGRGELYVRSTAQGREYLQSLEDFAKEAASSRIAVAEPALLKALDGLDVTLHPINAATSLELVLQRLRKGGDDHQTVDANYVRGEQQIYGHPPAVEACKA